jgi:hypothetical protein
MKVGVIINNIPLVNTGGSDITPILLGLYLATRREVDGVDVITVVDDEVDVDAFTEVLFAIDVEVDCIAPLLMLIVEVLLEELEIVEVDCKVFIVTCEIEGIF